MPRPVLRRSLLIEMGVLTGIGSILGITTGLGAIAIALHAVPEFLSIAPVVLSYRPPGAGLAPLLAAGVLSLLAAGFAAALALLGGIRVRPAPGPRDVARPGPGRDVARPGPRWEAFPCP